MKDNIFKRIFKKMRSKAEERRRRERRVEEWTRERKRREHQEWARRMGYWYDRNIHSTAKPREVTPSDSPQEEKSRETKTW